MKTPKNLLQLLFCACLCLFTANVSHAATAITNLYEALVPVTDRSEAERKRAIREGMLQVLVRYTGYSGVESFTGIEQALKNARSYMVEFAMETQAVPAVDGVSLTRSPAVWVRFNASKMEALATQLRLPVWSTSRPTVRYVVMEDKAGVLTLSAPDTYPALDAQMQSVFSARGLPAKAYKPKSLNAAQLWKLDRSDLFFLREESAADIFFVVRVQDGPGEQRDAELIVVEELEINNFHENFGNPFQDVNGTINQFVDSYASNIAYAAGSGYSTDIFIGVLGLDDFAGYRGLLDTLTSLEQVSNARLEGMTKGQMLFRVNYARGSESLFKELFEKAGLQRVSGGLPSLGTKTAPHLLSRNTSASRAPAEQIFYRPDSSGRLRPGELK